MFGKANDEQAAWDQMREAWTGGPALVRGGRTSLRGTAVNGGIAIGAARIVREADDSMKLKPGDVLVLPRHDAGVDAAVRRRGRGGS